MLLTSPMHVREAEHLAIARDVAAFLARGGKIDPLPRGLMRETTARQRINPSSPAREERAAAARAARAVPAPRARVRKPKPERKHVRRFAQPGSQKALILLELLQGPVSAKFLAGAIGTQRNTVLMALYDLRTREMVRDDGAGYRMTWVLTREGRALGEELQRGVKS